MSSRSGVELVWSGELAPGHERDADGTLAIGGERADALASTFGTPAIVFDLRVMDAAIAQLQTVCAPNGVRIAYAAKALPVTAVLQRLAKAGIGVDVCSLGELVTAERAQVPARSITFHGAGKTDIELRAICEGRAGRAVVDSIDELHRLAAIHRQDERVELLLRLNTGIDAHTHEFVRTAGDDSKFGIAPREEAAAIELLGSHPALRLGGLHAHIGSQIFETEPFAENAALLAAAVARFQAAGFPIQTVVAGGGFGVQMHPETPVDRLEFAECIDAVVSAVRTVAPRVSLEIEPGRYLVAHAGTSLYRVLAIKRFERRTFAIVDGSMADNPRPALYGAYHHVTCVRKSAAPFHPVTVCGRSCENDELADTALPSDLAAGDLLAFCTTGAYTYSMAGNYNRFLRPPVIGVGDGDLHLLARRETLDEVLSRDV